MTITNFLDHRRSKQIVQRENCTLKFNYSRRKNFFSPPKRPDRLYFPRSLLSSGYRLFP